MSTICITGASSGLGATLSQRCVAAGHRVVGIARNQERLAAQQHELGANYLPVAADLAQTSALPALATRCSSLLGDCPDVVIHNAGVFHLGDFTAMPAEKMEHMWRINTLAPMQLTHAWLPQMLQRGQGRIIFVASVAGTHGLAGQASYCASKHGMVGFADALSNELRGSGVHCHTICPGGIHTPLWTSGEVQYPGNVEDTMSTDEMADLILFIMKQPNGTLYRRVVCFPESEWH